MNVTEVVRKHHKKNQLNGKRRPQSLLSGLVFCGCCGGPYSLRGAGRFACSNHISKGTCPNSRTIRQDELEEPCALWAQGSHDGAEERRSNGDAWQVDLAKVEKQIAQIVEAIVDGMYHPSMKEKMAGLETQKAELTSLLADAPEGKPDMLPTTAAIYANKVAKLTQALNRPAER